MEKPKSINRVYSNKMSVVRVRVLAAHACAYLVSALFMACGGGKSDGGIIVGSQGRKVAGNYVNNYISISGEASRPVDLSNAVIQALSPNGSGGYTVYSGEGKSDGSFYIPSVPNGEYLLYVKTAPESVASMVWTSESEVHLGGQALGRADWKASTQSTTPFQVNWPSSSGISALRHEVVVPSLGRVLSTSTRTSSLWTYGPGAALIDAARDAVLVTRLEGQSQPNGDIAYRIGGTYAAPPFSQVDGAKTTLNPQFSAPVGPMDQIAVNVDRDAFSAMIRQSSPTATLSNPEVRLHAHPAPLAAGYLSNSPRVFTVTASSGTGRWLGGPYSFQNPFPSNWPLVAQVSNTAWHSIVIPGTGREHMSVGVSYTQISAREGQSVISSTPMLSAVRNLRVNDRSLAQYQVGVGTTPTLTWDAPSLGNADSYSIGIYRLEEDYDSVVAYLTLSKTKITLPRDLLNSGKWYYFIIWSEKCSNFDARYPYRGLGLPRYIAPLVSELIQP